MFNTKDRKDNIMPLTEKRLFRLHELKDYKVSSKDFDVRGWVVMGSDRQLVGKVAELIVDIEAQKVRYLEVKMAKELYSGEGDRHLLIPIGAANLHEKDDVVYINNLERNSLRFYPVYHGESITREYEESLKSYLNRTNTVQIDENQDIRNEKNIVGTRRDVDILEDDYKRSRLEKEKFEEYNRSSGNVDPVKHLEAQRDMALAELKMVKAERDLLKVQLENLKAGVNPDDFYKNSYFDDDNFLKNRKK